MRLVSTGDDVTHASLTPRAGASQLESAARHPFQTKTAERPFISAQPLSSVQAYQKAGPCFGSVTPCVGQEPVTVIWLGERLQLRSSCPNDRAEKGLKGLVGAFHSSSLYVSAPLSGAFV